MALRSYYHVWRQGLAADRPATPSGDMGYFATDTGQVSIYDSGAAAWNNIGFAGLATPVAISQGGTGQTSQTAAYDALSPNTTKGDIEVYNGTDNVRLAVGSDVRFLSSDSAQSTGLSWVHNNRHLTLYTGSALANYVTGAAYAPVFGADSPTRMKMSLTAFREARIIVRGSIMVASVSGTVKIVDVTNTQDMTGTITLNSTTVSTQTGSWTSLNSATYAGDAEFEAQALEGVAADVLRFENIQLELR